METILYNISQVLGITIIHSLWQGLLVYFVLRLAFIVFPSLTAVKKYNLAIIAMVSISIWFIYTLLTELQLYTWANLKPVQVSSIIPYLNLPISSPQFINQHAAYYYTIAGYLPYISIIYVAGLVTNLLKLGWEWNKIRQIKRSLIPAEQMQQYINSFSKKLNINKYIQLKFSEMVDVPCMTGYFKPLILLPVSMATYLSACEIEAILLHELSHIKRNDYVVNLLQQVIKVMLYFNPFAQLINRIANQERENSCDDLVVEKTGRPLIYARALLKLEQTRESNLQLALAVTGKKHHLLNRIERIMKTNKPIGGIRHLLVPALLLAGGLASIAWFNPKGASAKPAAKVERYRAANNVTAAASGRLSVIEKVYPSFNKADTLFNVKRDTNKYLLANDTIRHGKGKFIFTDKDGNKKEYDSIDSLPPELRNQVEAVRKQTDELKRHFNSAEWKAQMKTMQKQAAKMHNHFNSPEWKKQMLAMKKQGEEMKKHFDSPEWKKQMEDMKLTAEEMKKQFDSPEWKKQMEDIQLQGEKMKKQFDSPEWKKQMEDIQLQGEKMKKQFDSPKWKKQMEDMKLSAEEMKKHFDSPEWKKQMEDMKLSGEEMKKQFDSPEWKKQMEDMKLSGEEMKKQFDSPEWKKQMEDMKWDFSDSNGEKHKAAKVKQVKKVKAVKKKAQRDN